MTEGTPNDRISVSRDTLRAELALLELRLMEKLASRQEYSVISSRVENLERTALLKDGPVYVDIKRINEQMKEISGRAVSELRVKEIAEDTVIAAATVRWTAKQRLMAIIASLGVLFTFALQVYLATKK